MAHTMRARMNIYFEAAHKAKLDAMSKRTGIPVAELIRQAINDFLKHGKIAVVKTGRA
jgi:hypothetical protein